MTVDARTIGPQAASFLTAALKQAGGGWQPLPHQVPPPGSWYGWLLLAGRGAGKTDACAEYMAEHVRGPACLPGPVPHWMSIIGPTLGDAATSCYYGPSGLRVHDPSATLVTSKGGTSVRWPNGSEAKLFGAHGPEDVERLRSGGNRCLAWLEELAAWRHIQECYDHMRFGLRVGPRPHWIGSTTPKAKPLIKKLAAGQIANVVMTHASTYDNPHLPEHIRQQFIETYGGTSLGAQELDGRVIDQDENALWTREIIERNRLQVVTHELQRVTVGVDPSGGSGEQGIVAFGRSKRVPNELPIGFVLGDWTVRKSPAEWGKRAVQCAIEFEADDIAVETNFGGDMAMSTIRGAADALGITIPIKKLTASRGKRPRAEPVSAVSAQNRLKWAGVFEELEDQCCIWTDESDESPDRLDAMVWGAWNTKLVSLLTTVSRSSYAGREMTQRRLG